MPPAPVGTTNQLNTLLDLTGVTPQAQGPSYDPSQTPLTGSYLGSGTVSAIGGAYPDQSGGTTTMSGTSSSGTGNPGLDAFLQAGHLAIGQLQGQDQAAQLAQNTAAANVNGAYTPQLNTLQTQLAQGHAANQLAQTGLDEQKAKSLRDLGTQLRGMFNNYQNQLGVAGAGNSSAADLIGHALSQQANTGRSDIGQQYGLQQTGINQNDANLQANFQNQKDTIDAWKTQTLNQIAAQYAQTRAAIESQMANVQSDEVRTALYMRDQAAANTALQQMQQTVTQAGSALDGLQKAYGQVNAPAADLSQYSQGYQVQQFTPEQLQGLTYSANAAPAQTTSTAPLSVGLQRKDNQTPALALAG